MTWLARWAWRVLVAPKVEGYVWLGRAYVNPGETMRPEEVEVMFREGHGGR